MRGDNAVDHHDKGTRGAADLGLASTEGGNEKPANDCGDQACGRIGTRGNGYREAERDRHHRDRKARH